jgi:glycerol-3-phosphate cytidylyltransferase
MKIKTSSLTAGRSMEMNSQERVVYLPGVFDLFHIGHLRAIQNAKKYGGILIVGVQSDKSVFGQKKKWPVINEQDRKRILFNIKGVDSVIIYDAPFQGKVLEVLKPHVLAVNETYGNHDRDQLRTLKRAQKLGITVVRIPYMKGISTTYIQETIRCSSTTKKSKSSGVRAPK